MLFVPLKKTGSTSVVGRQYHLDIGDNDFYIDLLFYHLKLRCYIVIDLKKGKFKPDYAGYAKLAIM
jgi:predicted nuclease of restriction endonuclease-like (RecB) superfamily